MSSTETLENTPENNPAAVTPEAHDHEGLDHAGHDHEGHDHDAALAMNPECTRELTLDIEAEEVSKAYRRTVAGYKKYAKLPGFRPGKVPETVLRRRFAEDIRKDVLESLLPERFNKAVVELNVKVVGQPQVKELTVDDGQPLHVKAAFEYVPEFSVEGYTEVTVEKPAATVTDEEFEREIEQLRESRSTIEPVEEERALVDGDWAQINYSGVLEGEEAPLAGEDALVEVGGKETVEAFTNALRGAKVGQQLKIEVGYPDDYVEAKLAGKTVAYEVEIKAIKKRVVPELDDEFAKELGNYESLADLREKVREHMTSRKSYSVQNETRERLSAALAERFSFAVPEVLVQEQIDLRLERGLRALAAQGMGAEQMRKLDFVRLRTAQREGATTDVKVNLILDRIADEEKVTVAEEDVERELQMAALQTREPIEQLRERLANEGGMARIQEQLRREKTAVLLVDRMPVQA